MVRGGLVSSILFLGVALVATAGCGDSKRAGTTGSGGTMGIAGSGGTAGGNAGTAGVGDAGGAAGAVGGHTGSGGRAGTGGSGTGGPLPTVAQLFPEGTDGSLDGRLVTVPCGELNAAGTDCNSGGAYYRGAHIACAYPQPLTVLHTFPVGGAPGVTYRVTMHFYGILGAKNYGTGVTRDAGTGRPGNQNSGSLPTPWATAAAGHIPPVSDDDTYEIRVDNQADQEVAAYYLNADTHAGQWSYVINFAKQINVIGGGRIRVRSYDRNCRQVKNCGQAGTLGAQCDAIANARIIDVSAASPAPANTPADQGGLQQPYLIGDGGSRGPGQWTLIDVVSVDSIVP